MMANLENNLEGLTIADNVFCNIQLRDGSILEISDKNIVMECDKLRKLVETAPNTGNNLTFQVTQFEPELVKSVLSKAVLYRAVSHNFIESGEFQNCLRDYTPEKVVEMIEVASVFRCNVVLRALELVFKEMFRGKPAECLIKFLGCEQDVNNKEWMMSRNGTFRFKVWEEQNK